MLIWGSLWIHVETRTVAHSFDQQQSCPHERELWPEVGTCDSTEEVAQFRYLIICLRKPVLLHAMSVVQTINNIVGSKEKKKDVYTNDHKRVIILC